MSTMVVQERHLWLNLAEMKDVDKARFLDAPIFQAGLFGDTVEGFAQQFSAVQQQTEAIQHILPRRDAPSTAAPGARPQSDRRRGRPSASSRAAPPRVEATPRPARRAPRRRAARRNPEIVGICSFSRDGENSAAPSPGGGPGGESSVSFCFCSAAGPRASGTHFLKEQFPFPPGSQVHGTTVCDALLPHSRPQPILPVAKRVWFGDDIPPHAPLASPVWDPGSSVRNASECTAFCTIHPYSLSLHHHRYVDCAVGAACTASGGVTHAAQPVSLAHVHNSTRLRDSVRQATSQVQRRSRDIGGSPERPCLAQGDASSWQRTQSSRSLQPERRQGFYSPYFIVPKKRGGLRPILDLRVLNWALHKLPFKMRTRRRIIKCIQPLDWFAAIDLKDAYIHVSILLRHRPFLRFAFEGRAWQYRVLPFGLPLPRYGRWASGSSTTSTIGLS